jgi:hypothetical protein
MTLSDEAKQIRIEVARLRPGRGRKYSVALRRRILAWVVRAKETGMLENDCGNALGIPMHRFDMWREVERRDASASKSGDGEPATVALVPVQTPSTIQVGLGLTFVGPRGCRVEGLTLEQAFALLREFE